MKKNILFIFALLTFFVPSYSSYASSLPALPNYDAKSYPYYVVQEEGGYIYFTAFTELLKICGEGNSVLNVNGGSSCVGGSQFKNITYYLNSTSDSWLYSSQNSGTREAYVIGKLYNNNFDIKNSSGDIIFKKKPIPEPSNSILLPLMDQLEMLTVLNPILSLVGLVVSCLVSWMALRKSWTWLLSQLRSL